MSKQREETTVESYFRTRYKGSSAKQHDTILENKLNQKLNTMTPVAAVQYLEGLQKNILENDDKKYTAQHTGKFAAIKRLFKPNPLRNDEYLTTTQQRHLNLLQQKMLEIVDKNILPGEQTHENPEVMQKSNALKTWLGEKSLQGAHKDKVNLLHFPKDFEGKCIDKLLDLRNNVAHKALNIESAIGGSSLTRIWQINDLLVQKEAKPLTPAKEEKMPEISIQNAKHVGGVNPDGSAKNVDREESTTPRMVSK